MLVPAPALFSMNTVWPHIAESFSASMRATISFGPPAATGTMIRTGFVGYPAFDVCARAASGHAAAPPSVTINSRRRIWIAMRPSRGGACPCNGRGRYHVFIPRCTVNDCSGSIATDEVEITRSRMSASPLKADNLHTISASPLSARTGCEQSQQKRLSLFDHLVGAGEQRGVHVDAERLGGREINNEIELGRLLDREVGWLRPPQNLVDKVASTPEQVWEVWSIRHQAARFDVVPGPVHRR